MFRLQLDTKGTLRLKLPGVNYPEEVLALGARFASYEGSLDGAARTPFYDTVGTLLTELDTAVNGRLVGEDERVMASEAVKRLEAEGRELTRQARDILAALYARDPFQAQPWGFDVRQTGRSAGTILMPDETRQALLNFLNKYSAKEESQSPEDRLPVPPLADVQRVRDGLRASLEVRDTGQAKRELGGEQRAALVHKLHDVLGVAAAYLIVTQFDHQITAGLQTWGYNVFTPGEGEEEEPEETPVG